MPAPEHTIAVAKIPVVPDLEEWQRFKDATDQWIDALPERLAKALDLSGSLNKIQDRLDALSDRVADVWESVNTPPTSPTSIGDSDQPAVQHAAFVGDDQPDLSVQVSGITQKMAEIGLTLQAIAEAVNTIQQQVQSPVEE